MLIQMNPEFIFENVELEVISKFAKLINNLGSYLEEEYDSTDFRDYQETVDNLASSLDDFSEIFKIHINYK